MNKSWPLWRKIITWIGSVVVGIFTIVGAIYTVRGFYATTNTPSQKTSQPYTQNQRTELTYEKPVKRNSNNSIHIEKSPITNSVIQPTTVESISIDKNSVVQNMKDSPGSLQIGVNKAPVTYNAAPPIKPIDERLRKLLGEIDPKIIPALQSGHTNFGGGITATQFNELQKLAKEPDANKYITISPDVKMGLGKIFGPEGVSYDVDFTLNPSLVKK